MLLMRNVIFFALLGACVYRQETVPPPGPPPVRLPSPEEAELLPDTLVLGAQQYAIADGGCHRLHPPAQPLLVQKKWVAAKPESGAWYPLLLACPSGSKGLRNPILHFGGYDVYVQQAVF